MRCAQIALAALLLLAGIPVAARAAEVDIEPLVEQIKEVGPKAAGNQQAAKAWAKLSQADAAQLPALLATLDDADPLAANWIRSAIDTIAERELKAGGKLPVEQLEAFVKDTSHQPRPRRMAFEWLAIVDKSAPDRLIPGFLQDPSVEFRRDAVKRLVDQAQLAKDKGKQKELYLEAFSGARDDDQIKLLAEKLKGLDFEVNLPRHFGFIRQWKLLGPFDNTDETGFHLAYPPEIEVDLDTEYAGKDPEKPIRWLDHATEDEYGNVDLNKALGKNKGATAYAYTEFVSPSEQDVQFRVTSHNAIRLWVNGDLVDQREVYHSGHSLDQYVSSTTLQPGKNTILLKVCENEQTQSWAQDWDFQLRICDPAGTAILSADRPEDE